MRLLNPGDPGYPRGLLDMARPSRVYCVGNALPGDTRSVAIVGTRAPSSDGEARARRLAARLALDAVTVVSGLARGIDTAAHLSCLDAGGRSIAVLGCGLDRVYPPENAPLAERIAARGAVLSRQPPGAPPTASALRARNLLIAALARAVVVIEAGSTSGARITARFALSLGRPLFLTAGVAAADWAKDLIRHPGAAVLPEDAAVEALEASLAPSRPLSAVPVQLWLPEPGA
ncbi:MAG TPA: DNA-processing protein DprA [Candidatus Binatia bacterium]|nr:DNA-processing protein DprA [Candidatus Binatia bacterium]